MSLLEKVKKFLQEYYKDEEVGGKQFKYGDQLVSGWSRVGVRWPQLALIKWLVNSGTLIEFFVIEVT